MVTLRPYAGDQAPHGLTLSTIMGRHGRELRFIDTAAFGAGPAVFDRLARHAPRRARAAVAGADRRPQSHAAPAVAVRAGPRLAGPAGTQGADVEPPLWLAGHIGWFAEWWIARNTQRAFGVDCPVRPTRLAAIDPQADDWWSPQRAALAQHGLPELPDLGQTKAYLLETLESTLELLDNAAETDAGLYFYRLALLHEDLRGEQLVVMAQTLGLPIGAELPPPAASREPLMLPATRWQLGLGDEGFAFAQERGTHEVTVPEFEIDAQPVNWNQFVEFVDDGGYDRPELWAAEGWGWVQQQDRRAPRHVEQIGAGRPGGGAVLQRRFGIAVRAAGHQCAMHLSWWEADAWARWAGRRVATEVEWEVAAHTAARARLPLGRGAGVDRGHAAALARLTAPIRGAPTPPSIPSLPSAARACCAALRSPPGRGCAGRAGAGLRCLAATTASSAFRTCAI